MAYYPLARRHSRVKLVERWRAAITVVGGAWVAVTLAFAGIALGGPTGDAEMITDHLYGSKFVNSNDGWIVGAFGAIWRTGNSGRSWHKEPSGTTEPLFSVDFADTRRGWVVGRSGLILHTQDGGASWRPQSSGTDKHLFGVDFADAELGCAVGDWGAIVRTRDGGATWELRSLAEDVILNSVFLLDRSLGWAAGEMGTIVATRDGGETWEALPTGVEKTLFDVHFADARRGWAVGLDGLILHTEDGGQTWTAQHGSTELGGLEQVGFVQAFDNPSLYAVTVVDRFGYAVGDIGAVFTSEDGGATWARRPVPDEWGLRWFRDISVAPGTHGVIVGAEGLHVPISAGRVEIPSAPAPAPVEERPGS